ncbi:EcoKI restriction-modification system protein HsdS [Chryseobacterium taklimakanense]|uniref:EcoKI restriction-modification system protein HsdS n=1 Tax=Chryseobacterium taklimakanense TaxID=536441 RepID=A0A239XV93_9FLAO|nr:hypothetical protein [Chryseobacterium taklimakanense]SNV49983.1 EcoKI restriction-modification system protein HsdS [Chryseobacterium taklimakanense]
MEGLEISVLQLTDVLIDNDNRRIDSEYFKKQFLSFFDSVPNLRPLGSLVKDGYRVVYENTKIVDSIEAIERKYPIFLQATDIKTPFISTENLFYVDNTEWERYPKGRIVPGEILIEVKGKIEKVAIVPDDFPKKTLVTGSLFKLTVNKKISKNVLLTYLISKFGVSFKDRYKTNLLISFVSKPDLYRIPVPTFSQELENIIDGLFKIITEAQKISKSVYKNAENILLEKLGLYNLTFSNENFNKKSLSDSFLKSGRLDAEYYQPQYEELLSHINSVSNDKLGYLVTVKKSIEPGSGAYQEEGVPFIRVSNLSKYGLTDPEIHLDRTEFSNIIKPTKDSILLSKDGTVGIAYKVEKDIDAITSGAILHLKVKNKEKILPDYLTLVLNSIVVKMQAERDAGGSIIQHWKPSEIAQVVIPILDFEIQQEISDLVQESFKLKNESEQLLQVAKQAVEIAIEQNEDKAMEFINQNSKDAGKSGKHKPLD